MEDMIIDPKKAFLGVSVDRLQRIIEIIVGRGAAQEQRHQQAGGKQSDHL